MSKTHVLQASYQMLLMQVPNDVKLDLTQPQVFANMRAPLGFKLHSFMLLKETGLVGQPMRMMLVFENLSTVEIDVPDANAPVGEDAE
jgi:hypothetical protein